jgi:hypothetical protein
VAHDPKGKIVVVHVGRSFTDREALYVIDFDERPMGCFFLPGSIGSRPSSILMKSAP